MKPICRTSTRLAALFVLLTCCLQGCHHRAPSRVTPTASVAPSLQQIEYPEVAETCANSEVDFMTAAPPTASNFFEQTFWDLSLEEAVELALSQSKVLQKLGGRVVSSPQGTSTLYDPAIQETDPQRGVEAALSAFDAQFTGRASLNHDEQKFNNPFIGGGANALNSNNGNLLASLSKTTAAGTQFTISSNLDYAKNNSPVNRFPSTWTAFLQAEMRQPLLRGAGTAVNRIAGPNAQPGVYNGVLIARIRGDVALADFEASVRDLVRDVERSYWELYFAYRDLDVKLKAREASRLIWDNRKQRVDAGLSRPDDEAQTRQQYYSFEQQVIDALSGNASGQTGILGAERQLRRLLGLANTDGRVLRPVTEPTIAPIRFDWNDAQQKMLCDRVEIRRQKWNVRQRQLELLAAKQLNLWQADLVASYGARGFGDDLFGNRGVPEGSAFSDLTTGQLDTWALALEVQGPVGNRQGHLAIRNAELQLMREKTLLTEQQRQLMLDLNAAYSEVDRAFASIKNTYNTRQAVMAELEPKRKRAEAGDEDVFFLLDAQQRATSTETAFHRAVVDYNLALQNFVYTSGQMLEHYNIHLAEDDSDSLAHCAASLKQKKYRNRKVSRQCQDVPPLSYGPVEESDLLLESDQPLIDEIVDETAPEDTSAR